MTKHKWQYSQAYQKIERTCEYCKKKQIYTITSYDKMTGTKYGWKPLVGKCTPPAG